ncbi:MAG TPA: DUF4350 domain-containing protein [Povalibacter sp.]|nr:DUF4350 domain-containing protein [Povalibacter sp.]
MKRDWILGGIAVVGLTLMIAWIARNTYWDSVTVPLPLRGEAATNPSYSMQRLAEALGGRTERRDVLGAPPPPNAVIVLSFWHWSLIDSRRQQLEQWVEAGGRLIIAGALVGGDEQFEQWSGIGRDHRPDTEEPAQETDQGTDADKPADRADSDEPADRTDEDRDDEDHDTQFRGRHWSCMTLKVDPAPGDTAARSAYEVCSDTREDWLTSRQSTQWALLDGDVLQALRVKVGNGSVTQLNFDPFDNRQLLKNDHALLFVAATQLRHGDEIVFLSEEKHSSLLSLMWTYGAPVIVLSLVLLAAALWRGSVRFGPLAAAPDAARRSIAEQIRGTGQFTLRFGAGRAMHAAVVRALHETAASHIPGYARLSAQDQVAAIARLTHTDADGLAETINYAGARRAAELRHAVMLLEQVRRRLLESKNTRGVTNAS